jgi:hypothetical protein
LHEKNFWNYSRELKSRRFFLLFKYERMEEQKLKGISREEAQEMVEHYSMLER